jgi:hypothetical protein
MGGSQAEGVREEGAEENFGQKRDIKWSFVTCALRQA